MSSLALQIPLPERFKNNQGLPDETKQEYSRILALYSSDTLDAAEWRISLTIANRTGNIYFPKTTKTIESDITRVTVIIMLTSGACNHASVDDTMGYGYYSKHDEAKHLAQIVSPILPLDSNASLTSETIYLNIQNFLTLIKATTKALKKWQQK